MENQQMVIAKTLEKLLQPSSILLVPTFTNILIENVHTNLTLGNALWFASQLNEIRGTEAMSFNTMPTRGTSGAPSWYELLDGPAIVRLVNQTINPFNRDITLRGLDIISEY